MSVLQLKMHSCLRAESDIGSQSQSGEQKIFGFARTEIFNMKFILQLAPQAVGAADRYGSLSDFQIVPRQTRLRFGGLSKTCIQLQQQKDDSS